MNHSRQRRLSQSFITFFTLAALVGCGEASDDDETGGAGGEQSTGASSSEPRAYGEGEYGILLSGPEPGIYCWYIEETVRICGGSKETDYFDICLPDERNCLLHQPDDTLDEGECYVRVDYNTVSGSYLTGDCEHHAAYWASDPSVQCLFHKHCANGQQCVDYRCE